ncbi:MAG: hypothetical protein IJL20_02980 [Lachnospiraceae bacterium]|nr:hypothetical protein [Lachnospiraceae bacterium]
MEETEKRLIDFDKRLSEDAGDLNQYLYQYKDCVRTKKNLLRRREEIKAELKSPLSAVQTEKLSSGKKKNDRSVDVLFRLDEIAERIQGQIDTAERKLNDIMSLMDFLPVDSLSRSIMENLYINRWDWEKVCKENHISRSQAKRYWKQGLYTLLKMEKVKEIVKGFKGE